MKVLLVRPPRYLWPVVNESDNYMLPLGLPCLAAVIRERMPDVEIKIIDCPPLKIGWKTLANMFREEKADIVGAGEEALYHHEAVKLFELAKEINPGTLTVGGGHFFSWTPEQSLINYPIDYIVRFEGEYTFLELLKVIRGEGDITKVKGIAYKRNGVVICTPTRPLIEDLDELPIAAYDLMPMGSYSPFGYFWPQGATIEHSRGCIDRCNFCSLWTFWGKHIKTDAEKGEFEVLPRYRSKSVERTLEEVDILYKKYNRRLLLWNDPTFNIDPKWSDEFCEKLIRRNYKDLYWWAFLRSDFVVRDERLGILEKMVKAGMINAFIGVERVEDLDYKEIDKHYTKDICREAFNILKRKYPNVHRQGTFLTGIRSENKNSLLSMVNYALDVGVEFMIFHPITPVPGTTLYQEAVQKGWLEDKDFAHYNWLQPVMAAENISLEEIMNLTKKASLQFILSRWQTALRGLFSPLRYRRRLYWWFLSIFITGLLQDIKDTILRKKGPKGASRFLCLKKPEWYDS
ncbi:MAG: cobalamin-dependent protein [Candidatus Omnitrophica bacterium]|nr:cobalamin-dependent protein [Candidatus Omnitrophota bacterium]